MKYIYQRNNNYYFRFRLTVSMQPFFKQNNYFTKSLQTSNSANASKYAKILLNKLNYIKQSIKMNVPQEKILNLIDDLTNTIFEDTETDLYNTDKVEDSIFALTLEDRLISFKNAYSNEDYTLVENEANNILKSLNLSTSDNKFNNICKLLLQSHINNLKIISDKIDNGGYYMEKPTLISKANSTPVVEKEEKSYTLKEAYDIFDKNLEASADTKNINKKYFQFLVKYLKNVNLNDIKKSDFISYKAKLSKEKTAKKQLLAIDTKKRYVRLVNNFFEYLYENDLMKILIKIKNYGDDMTETILSKKENYSLEELNKWYKWALNVDNEEFKWITLLAIFNGFSVSEITRLEKHNIKKVENIWCVQIEFTEKKRTKNLNRIRIIPLHLNLIALGFLDYIDGKSNDLFKITNTAFSRKMTNINREFVTTNPKRTFHRIRASFIDRLVQTDIRAEHVAALAGHSQEFKITLNDYSDKINVDLLSTALKNIDYKF